MTKYVSSFCIYCIRHRVVMQTQVYLKQMSQNNYLSTVISEKTKVH